MPCSRIAFLEHGVHVPLASSGSTDDAVDMVRRVGARARTGTVRGIRCAEAVSVRTQLWEAPGNTADMSNGPGVAAARTDALVSSEAPPHAATARRGDAR